MSGNKADSIPKCYFFTDGITNFLLKIAFFSLFTKSNQ